MRHPRCRLVCRLRHPNRPHTDPRRDMRRVIEADDYPYNAPTAHRTITEQEQS